jgi:endonuclease YncB( thermonuclease family)
VVRVIDGDTVVVNAHVWPQLTVEKASIRVLGIDTPELHGKCEAEKAMAKKAKAMMAEAFPPGTLVQLLGVKPDKYGGRFNARVLSADGQSWAALLFDAELAAPYTGQGPKRDWCAAPKPPNSD